MRPSPIETDRCRIENRRLACFEVEQFRSLAGGQEGTMEHPHQWSETGDRGTGVVVRAGFWAVAAMPDRSASSLMNWKKRNNS